MKYVHPKERNGERLNFWQSYSDMMAALLMVFILVLLGTLLQARKLYDEDFKSLAEQQQQLDEQQKQLDDQTKQLEDQTKQLEEAEAQLKEQQEIINDQQTQLEAIVGIRSELIEALKTEFSGSDLYISIDSQTGAITFDSNLLYEVGSYSLKQEGKQFLNDFLPRYLSVLLNDDFKDYVAEIIIEGHTDPDGTYMDNLRLSQNRAFSVMQYCLEENQSLLTQDQYNDFRDLATANGRSFSELIYNEDGTVNKDASRRVEIKFRLRDQEMIQSMAELLGSSS